MDSIIGTTCDRASSACWRRPVSAHAMTSAAIAAAPSGTSLVALPEGLLECRAGDGEAHPEVILVFTNGVERLQRCVIGAVEVAERRQEAGKWQQQLLARSLIGIVGK
jgi:hypothetical protein